MAHDWKIGDLFVICEDDGFIEAMKPLIGTIGQIHYTRDADDFFVARCHLPGTKGEDQFTFYKQAQEHREWQVGDQFEAKEDRYTSSEMKKAVLGKIRTVKRTSQIANETIITDTEGCGFVAAKQKFIFPETTGEKEADVSQDKAQEIKPAKESKFKDVAVERSGDKIILPEGMTYPEGVEWLRIREKEDDNKIAIMESIECYPFDGAYALSKALKAIYGWVGLVPTPGWFGAQNPPIIISIEVDANEKVQIPWGRMTIPALGGGFIETSIGKKDGRFIFQITGEIKQKYKAEVMKISEMTRKYVREESIYRGKAFFINIQDEARFNPDNCPRFIDTQKVDERDLVLTSEVGRQVQNSLFTPLEKTELCRQHRIPLKRGILFEGPYGTGKTLTAYVASKKAVANGWTFIYLAEVAQLAQAIKLAEQYAPAVIFGEDIDRAMSGERSVELDKILNTIDGIDTKGKEIIVCLTTNHVEQINPAMLRPGRLDAVISILPPDAEAAERLVKTYARGLLVDDIKLGEVCKKMSGQIPAVIREIVERAKLAAITRLETGEDLKLDEEDIDAATDSMLNHLKLMKPKMTDEVQTAANRIGAVMASELSASMFTNGKGDSVRKMIVEAVREVYES